MKIKVSTKKTVRKILAILGIAIGVTLLVSLVWGVYITLTNPKDPTIFTLTNDTNRAVKVSDCFTHDNYLEPGHSGTVQVASPLDRGASCEIEDAASGDRLGCLFAPQPVGEHDIILISALEPDVPSSECGRP